ncbi:hypothetical protein AVEN_13016-1 [Araneus ventricosus]|uniref:Uncharacterized protein n=1 Tax=Araneus ventricosus TaxID=182803 RepID=A0A4Y2HMA8_ARAVE|nr:hypothetical protein AVEN_13016-1 [Araneus ventricosus]
MSASTSSPVKTDDVLNLDFPPQDFNDKNPDGSEIENDIRITSARSLSEPSHHKEISRITTVTITKITAVLFKARTSIENRNLIQTELETLTYVLFDKVAENGCLRTQMTILQEENTALNAQVRQIQPVAPTSAQGPRVHSPPAAKTFASVLKQNTKKKPPPKHVSLVFAKDNSTSSEEVKEILLKSLSPSKIKVGVRNVRKLAKGVLQLNATTQRTSTSSSRKSAITEILQTDSRHANR